MLAIIIGALILVGIIVAVICSICRTPTSLRGYYGAMFLTIAAIGGIGALGLAVLSLI